MAPHSSTARLSTGYWNLAHNPYGLRGTGITPGLQDVPAIQVTVQRSAGHNGGPVQNWIASVTSLIGITSFSLSPMATAVMAPAGTVTQNNTNLVPITINKSVADQMSKYSDKDHLIRIGSDYHYPTSNAGQWTSFLVDSNNVPTIRDLFANGAPTPLSVGDSIWIQPGTKTTLYSSVPVPADVVMPVVQDIDTHAYVPIISFIGFHITASVGGSGKYIEGFFEVLPPASNHRRWWWSELWCLFFPQLVQ